MIFTSLQVLRNSYKYNFEKTNILSKNIFAIYFLNYFYHTVLIKRFLNFIDINVRVKFLTKLFTSKKRFTSLVTELYTVDFFYFIGSSWCLLIFKILEFTSLNPSVFRLKPLKKRTFIPRRSTLNQKNLLYFE